VDSVDSVDLADSNSLFKEGVPAPSFSLYMQENIFK
jgi:hypothetical protein